MEFETPDDGFVVVFYRHGTQKLSGTAQKTAQKKKDRSENHLKRSTNQKFYSV